MRLHYVATGFYRLSIDSVTYEIEEAAESTRFRPAWRLLRGTGPDRELIHEASSRRELRRVLEEIAANRPVDPLGDRLTRLVQVLVSLEAAEAQAAQLGLGIVVRSVRVALVAARRERDAIRRTIIEQEPTEPEQAAA
jgi:hypothetical protein